MNFLFESTDMLHAYSFQRETSFFVESPLSLPLASFLSLSSVSASSHFLRKTCEVLGRVRSSHSCTLDSLKSLITFAVHKSYNYLFNILPLLGYMYTYSQFALLYSRNEHNIVKQLYSNKN